MMVEPVACGMFNASRRIDSIDQGLSRAITSHGAAGARDVARVSFHVVGLFVARSCRQVGMTSRARLAIVVSNLVLLQFRSARSDLFTEYARRLLRGNSVRLRTTLHYLFRTVRTALSLMRKAPCHFTASHGSCELCVMCDGPPYVYCSSSYSASFSAAASSTALFRSRTRCLCTTRSRSSSGIPRI